MTYQALYRTYRPRHFSELVGQEHVVRTLLNSVEQNRIGHAYLFSGPRGTGKTTVARILARSINCENPVGGEPCDKCDRCKGSEEGLGVIEIDAASHGSVDDMRQLVAQVNQVPLSGGMMVYIIDEVHMLSKEAFNAFLKTLEEPPPHAVFVLATTEPGKLLATIHSRCQQFTFRRLPVDLIAGHIRMICEKENAPAEETALKLIARVADGSVRDSISVLEQAIAFEPEGLTLEGVRNVLGIPDRMDIRALGGHIVAGDPGRISASFADLIESGREPGSILTELLSHFRDLLFVALDIEQTDLELLPEEERNALKKQAVGLNVESIHRAIALLAKCEGEIKWEDEAALLLEVALLRLAAGFSREPATERRPGESVDQSVEASTAEMFPEPAAAPPVDIPRKQPPRTPGRTSLTGGISLKNRRAAQDGSTPAGHVTKQSAGEAGGAKPAVKSRQLRIPEDADPFWKNALESVREASVAEFVLLAEGAPSPAPPDWPDKGAGSLDLMLKYPYDCGLLVKLINQPAVLNRLTARLEEALERPLALRVARVRGEAGGSNSGVRPVQVGMHDGEGAVTGSETGNSPSLFPGAARQVPSDPDQKKVHDLIFEDFPDYKFEQGNAG